MGRVFLGSRTCQADLSHDPQFVWRSDNDGNVCWVWPVMCRHGGDGHVSVNVVQGKHTHSALPLGIFGAPDFLALLPLTSADYSEPLLLIAIWWTSTPRMCKSTGLHIVSALPFPCCGCLGFPPRELHCICSCLRTCL